MLTTTLLAETIMNEGAQKCGLSNEAIRQRNLIPSGYRTPYGQIVPKSHFPRIWDEGLAKSEYAKRREKVDLFNAGSRWTKRGLALIPTMYGGEQPLASVLSRWAAFSHTDGAVFPVNFPVNMLNQIGAQVLVYTDGTVLVSHGGVEMGQGLVRDTSLMPASVDHVERLVVCVAEHQDGADCGPSLRHQPRQGARWLHRTNVSMRRLSKLGSTAHTDGKCVVRRRTPTKCRTTRQQRPRVRTHQFSSRLPSQTAAAQTAPT